MQEMLEMQIQSLGWEDPLEEEMANPLQYSCLENLMDRGAYWATAQRVREELDTTEVTWHAYTKWVGLVSYIYWYASNGIEKP